MGLLKKKNRFSLEFLEGIYEELSAQENLNKNEVKIYNALGVTIPCMKTNKRTELAVDDLLLEVLEEECFI